MTEEQLHSLQARAHVHSDECYGQYEPCGEHHRHDDKCGSRPRLCGLREDRDLKALLEECVSVQRNHTAQIRNWELGDRATASAIRQFCLTLKLDPDQQSELCKALAHAGVPAETQMAIVGWKPTTDIAEVQFDFEYWRQF